VASRLDESNKRAGLKLSRAPPESLRDLATTVPRRTRTRAMTKACRGQIASGPCLGSRRAPRKFRPSGDGAALKWSSTALRPCRKLPFASLLMEVYAVGNDAAIVIAPLDRDGCLARRSKQAASGGSEPWLTARSELIEQGVARASRAVAVRSQATRRGLHSRPTSVQRTNCRLPRDVGR